MKQAPSELAVLPHLQISKHGIASINDRKIGPPSTLQVEIARHFLKLYAVRRAGINWKLNSYGLKHLIERVLRSFTPQADELHRFIRAEMLRPEEFVPYIPNGAVILAALELGYRIVRLHPTSPNAAFDFALVTNLDREIEELRTLWRRRAAERRIASEQY